MNVSGRMIGGAVGIAAVAAIATWGVISLTDDPDREVAAVDVGTVSAETGGTAGSGGADGSGGTAAAPASSRTVVELEQLSGTAVRDTDDGGAMRDDPDLSVEGVELDFGPEEWVTSVGQVEDFDGDGNTENLRRELEGLVDQPVGLLVVYDDGERDEADVYEINGVAFRDPSGPAPWESDASAPAATRDEVAAAAVAEIGAGARAIEVDRDDDNGTVTWDVEVVDADGREHTVLLNAAGEVQGSSPED